MGGFFSQIAQSLKRLLGGGIGSGDPPYIRVLVIQSVNHYKTSLESFDPKMVSDSRIIMKNPAQALSMDQFLTRMSLDLCKGFYDQLDRVDTSQISMREAAAVGELKAAIALIFSGFHDDINTIGHRKLLLTASVLTSCIDGMPYATTLQVMKSAFSIVFTSV